MKGLFAGAPEAIGNNLFWSALYVPPYDLIFPNVTRAWATNFGGWVVFEWDNFFNALLTSLEDKSSNSCGHTGRFTGADCLGVRAQLRVRYVHDSRPFPTSCRGVLRLEGFSKISRPGNAGMGLPSAEEVARVVAERPGRRAVVAGWES